MNDDEFTTNPKKRRRTTVKETLTACVCCKFPLSERHHMLDFAYHGEHNYTIPLCPNCHMLFHLIHSAYILKSERSRYILGTTILKMGFENPTIQFLHDKVNEAEDVRRILEKKAIEYVMGNRASN